MSKEEFQWKREWQNGVRQGGTMNIRAMNENLLAIKTVLDKYKIPFVLI